MKQELNVTIARKVLETVDQGLVSGLGKAKPGQMCVEAAVCYAYGLPNGDNPPCVGSSIRAFKIALNDRNWSSPKARAKGMRGLAIAQLGSDILDQEEFRKNLQKKTIQKLLPKIIRLVAGLAIFASTPHQAAMLSAANKCEESGSSEAAFEAQATCCKARNAYAAYAYAAAGAAAAAAAADDDADAYAYAAAYAAGAAAAAAAAADDADAYAYAAAKRAAIRDEWLTLEADICLEVLKEMKSPGCEYLYLLDN